MSFNSKNAKEAPNLKLFWVFGFCGQRWAGPSGCWVKKKHSWHPVKWGSLCAAAQENISVLAEWVVLEEEGIADRNIRTLFHFP